MHVMTISSGKDRTEIHVLNPGETLVPFGGSRSGLRVGKTASLVTRTITSYGLHDVEHDIFSASVWAWIGGLINDTQGDVKASQPTEDGAS